MPKQTKKTSSKGAPELPAEVVAATTSDADPGSPTMEPDTLMSETRLEQEARPTMTPPAEVVEQEIAAEGIAAWHNGKKVLAMWSNAAPRNAHASIAGMGWKRLSDANDSSFLTLTMMCSHAEQKNADCNFRIEADGEVHEVYVW